MMEKLGKPKPQTYKDMRKLLEDKSIDAISIASPNHWHTLMAIWACQAGKDVYVEKPCSHNIFEGKQFVRAARKYNRMVQQGSQIRSSVAIQEARAEHARRPDRRCLHGARPVLQVARHHRPRAPRTRTRRCGLRPVDRPGARCTSSP